MYKIVEFSHLLIEQFYNNNKDKNLVFIDATCGRGNDTLKLAETLNHTGTIVAYDIQNEAIKDTKEFDPKKIISYLEALLPEVDYLEPKSI